MKHFRSSEGTYGSAGGGRSDSLLRSEAAAGAPPLPLSACGHDMSYQPVQRTNPL